MVAGFGVGILRLAPPPGIGDRAPPRPNCAGLVEDAFEPPTRPTDTDASTPSSTAGASPCGLELVRSIMRELGLQPCQPRPWRAVLTEQDGHVHRIPDLLDRDFTATAPGEKLVGDITYIPTWEGWLYLATVIDCHTKMVVGYAMDDNYKTPLISRAIRDAADRFPVRPGAIFHSDRGSNYTSAEFAATLTELGLRQSVGRTGICYDNAMAESFFAALKNECVHRTAYPTRAHARADIARYIEFWYNRNRLHSGLGYRTPQESLEAWTKDQEAA